MAILDDDQRDDEKTGAVISELTLKFEHNIDVMMEMIEKLTSEADS